MGKKVITSGRKKYNKKKRTEEEVEKGQFNFF